MLIWEVVTMLEIEHLSVSYGKINAVRDISLAVGKGEIVSLIGANGAGKTTTLKAVSGLLKTKDGFVRWEGNDLTDRSPSKIVAAGIVQVPEGRQVFSGMTVLENLLLGGYLVKEKEVKQSRIEEVYRLFPILRERQRQKAGSLSGGEQQMLAIGRAIVSGAKALLLDEPSLGLAPVIIEQVFDVLLKLRDAGINILLVEQNAGDALTISDRRYIMESGQLVLSGTGKELAFNANVRSIYLGGGI